MGREILEAHLQQAEWRVALAARDIHEQVLKINDLKCDGHDDRQAREGLAQLEELFQQHASDRRRLRRELEVYYKDGSP